MKQQFNQHAQQPSLEKLIPIVNSVTKYSAEDLSVVLTQIKQLDERQFIGGEVQKKAFIQTLQDQVKKKININ